MSILNFFKRNKNQTESELESDILTDEKDAVGKLSWVQKLKHRLSNSNLLFKRIFNIFSESEFNYDSLEEILLNLDIDYELTEYFINKIKHHDKWEKLNPESAKALMKKLSLEILMPYKSRLNLAGYKTSPDDKIVIIFCGINGGGKTTSIAKIATLYKEEYKPLMVACDSFRAAATDQLESLAKRTNIEIFFGEKKHDEKAQDPASIAYQSIDYAQKNCHDLVLIDTSGRLHNNVNLMLELQKIDRVLKKHNPKFAQEVILVLDGTMGQNLKDQIENFNKTLKISGLIITKLDGIARGGIILSLVHKYKIPIYFIGIGEKDTDINRFDEEEFVSGLFD